MDNTTPPPSGGQQNQPPNDDPQGAETERIIIEPSSSSESQYTPSAGQPYTGGSYTGPPEQAPEPHAYPPAQPTVPMSGPPPGYQPPPQQPGVAGQPGYQPQPYGQQQAPQYQPPPQQYQQYPPQQTVVTTQKKGGMPAWVWVLIGLFVALILACGLIYWFVMRAVQEAGGVITSAGDTIGASFTVAAFDIALQTNDYEGAYDLLGGDLASRYSPEDLEERWEALSSSGSVTTDMSDVRMSGGRPQLTWSLSPADGGEQDIVLTMEQSGDDWKIVEASPDLLPAP